MKVVYIHHSGFLVETDRCYLLFDYFEGTLPELNPEKPLYIFASHSHPDHFSESVFQAAWPFRTVFFVLSDDIFERRAPKEYRDKVSWMGPHETKTFAHLTVETLLSTDKGVAFLVETEGKLLYHAGDLNCWVWPGEPSGENEDMRQRYLAELKRLEHREIFAAFVPLDPRQETDYSLGLRYFLQSCGATHVFPMHMWKKFSVIEDFLRNYPEYAGIVERIAAEGQIFEL